MGIIDLNLFKMSNNTRPMSIENYMFKFFNKNNRFMCKMLGRMCSKLTIKPAGIYLLKVNNKNTRTRCDIYSKLTIKTPERRQWLRSGVLIVNFAHVIAGWEDIRTTLTSLFCLYC